MLLTGARRSKRNTSQPNASLTPSVNNTSQPNASLTPSVNNTSQPNASLTPSVNNVSTPSHIDAVQAVEPTDGANAMTDHQADGHIIDAIPQDDGHNNLGNEDCYDEHLDNVIAGRANAITQPVVHNDMTMKEEWNRGVNMGHGLERINRSRRGKLPVVIPQGHIRPLVPIIAAKYATECNIAGRSHVPVFTHWKKYKAKENRAVIARYLGTLQAKFDIGTKDPVVGKGCLEMMKTAVRSWRYKLKQGYFDPFPLHLVINTSPIPSTNDLQWAELKDMWMNPKKMEVCQKNKDNRGKVKFHQKTGSCSYPVFVEKLEDKEQDGEKEKVPVALKLFKACHYSKKTKGFTPTVQSVITEIENRLAAQPAEGEEPKFDVQVVSEVLDEKTKKDLCLQNVGMEAA